MNKLSDDTQSVELLKKDVSKSDLLTAVIKKCYDCCGYCPEVCSTLTNVDLKEAKEGVENCEITTCPLWKFRLLDTYKKKRILSDEEKEKRRVRLANLRDSKLNKQNS